MTDSIELHPSIVERLRTMPVTPVTLRKTFLLLTRAHYSAASNYGVFADKLKDFIWDASSTPKLFIDLDYSYDPNNMDRRPAIFVGGDNFLYEQTVLDGKVGQTADNAGEEFYNRGLTKVIIRHVGKTPDESLQLGDLSAQFFRGLRKVMKTEIGLTRYVVSQLASTKPFDKQPVQADKHFVADLMIDLAFNANWMIWTEGHRLKDWAFDEVVKNCGGSAAR